jgi:hypothetical protein
MTESAREEALRLSIEAGLWECDSSSHNWRGHEQHIERLIALARQRQNRCVICGRGSDSYNLYCVPCVQSSVTHALAVAPKPGEGT